MLKKLGKAIAWALGGAVGLSVLLVVLFRFVPVPYTPLMAIRAYEAREQNRPLQLKKTWVPLAKINPNLQLAVIASEDQNFVDHWGFDFDAIQQAAQYNKISKDRRGASTISQQVAKNVFLWPSRTWLRKGLEAYFTVLIELVWSKQRIMEVYLNVIEMGDGIFGAEAAAQAYYNQPAQALTAFQAAYIAASLPNPRRFNPAQPNLYMHAKSGWIVNKIVWLRANRILDELN
jgi:monofunctional biosynthetic peptidoglycan transglycosylase